MKITSEKLQNGKRVEELQGDIGEVAEKAKEIIETMK